MDLNLEFFQYLTDSYMLHDYGIARKTKITIIPIM